MIILGIGGILGDAASAILKDGRLAAAVEESKLSRQSLQPGARGAGPTELPEQSIALCLALAGVFKSSGGGSKAQSTVTIGVMTFR